jgi:hypothetical protein
VGDQFRSGFGLGEQRSGRFALLTGASQEIVSLTMFFYGRVVL